MTPSTSTAIQNIPLTTRDVQWLTALDAAISTLLSPHATDDEVEHNMDALEYLYVLHYSYDEALALRNRLHAILPADTPMRFTTPELVAASRTTLVS